MNIFNFFSNHALALYSAVSFRAGVKYTNYPLLSIIFNRCCFLIYCTERSLEVWLRRLLRRAGLWLGGQLWLWLRWRLGKRGGHWSLRRNLGNLARCSVKSDVESGARPGRFTISGPHPFAWPGHFLTADSCQSVQGCLGGKEQQPTRAYTAGGVHCFVWLSLSRGAQRDIADNHHRDTS